MHNPRGLRMKGKEKQEKMGNNLRKVCWSLLHNEVWRDTASLLTGTSTWPCRMFLDRLYREIITWNSPSEEGRESGFHPVPSCLLSPFGQLALWVVNSPVLLGCFIGPMVLRKPEFMLCEGVCHQGVEFAGESIEPMFAISWPQAAGLWDHVQSWSAVCGWGGPSSLWSGSQMTLTLKRAQGQNVGIIMISHTGSYAYGWGSIEEIGGILSSLPSCQFRSLRESDTKTELNVRNLLWKTPMRENGQELGKTQREPTDSDAVLTQSEQERRKEFWVEVS